MKNYFWFTAGSFALLLTGFAIGQTTPPALAAGEKRAVFIEDQEKGEFRFVIDGVTAFVVTAGGLRVREDILYRGSITDTGTGVVDTTNVHEAAP